MLKTTPNFALFDPMKIRGGVGKISIPLLNLYLWPNLRNTFDSHQLRVCWAQWIDKKRKGKKVHGQSLRPSDTYVQGCTCVFVFVEYRRLRGQQKVLMLWLMESINAALSRYQQIVSNDVLRCMNLLIQLCVLSNKPTKLVICQTVAISLSLWQHHKPCIEH